MGWRQILLLPTSVTVGNVHPNRTGLESQEGPGDSLGSHPGTLAKGKAGLTGTTDQGQRWIINTRCSAKEGRLGSVPGPMSSAANAREGTVLGLRADSS